VFCRFLAGLSPFSAIDAGSKKAGHLTVYDAGPARGSKCAIDHVNFAVV
jgi:hypothetical protein